MNACLSIMVEREVKRSLQEGIQKPFAWTQSLTPSISLIWLHDACHCFEEPREYWTRMNIIEIFIMISIGRKNGANLKEEQDV